MEWHSPSAEYLKSLTGHTDHIYGLTTLKDGTLVKLFEGSNNKILGA